MGERLSITTRQPNQKDATHMCIITGKNRMLEALNPQEKDGLFGKSYKWQCVSSDEIRIFTDDDGTNYKAVCTGDTCDFTDKNGELWEVDQKDTKPQ